MRRMGTCVAVFLAATMLGASAVSAATPREIYRDYADNGRLDGHYSKADLDRALKSAVLQGYGDGDVQTGLAPAAQSRGVAATEVQGRLPFTGLDLALMVVGGATLILVGFGLRRLGRRTG
jgi:hypothetical protein